MKETDKRLEAMQEEIERLKEELNKAMDLILALQGE